MNTQSVKRNYLQWAAFAAAGVTVLTLLAAYALACSFVYLAPSLPTVEAMRKVELQVPLRVYTRGGELIAQIGEQRRIPVTYEEIPVLVRQAFLAAEDDGFFEHAGVDVLGVLRAALINLVSAEKAQGASTITQQAARNMFLTLDKTWRRKLAELFVTLRMEREFSKQEILGLYLNVIFFGQRAYGVAAASETYFGKPLDQLTISEAATLAGIPQAPSRFNPITNPELAGGRRAYVLRRMRELGFIDAEAAENAKSEPVRPRVHALLYDVEAPYVAEMARLEIRTRFGAAAESAGYKVYTTLDGRLQSAANRAVRIGLIEYDRRHGWRGPLGHAEIGEGAQQDALNTALEEYSSIAGLLPAVVVSVAEKSARVFVKARGFATIDWDGLVWARKQDRDVLGPAPKSAGEVISRGDVVYVVTDGKLAQLAQVPEAQSALVSLDPDDAAIVALVGGFDYFTNKYNRVTQAKRLPGSAFKPFLYSAALEDGFTPSTVVLDAPVVLEGEGIEAAWRPENSGGQFHGPTRLREALVRSRNLVSIRLLRSMGTQYSIDYITKFGFAKNALPPNLTLALGTLQTTPLELATGYATFANGGFRVQPYFIERIENSAGKVVYQAAPRIACQPCEHAVDLSNAVLLGTREEKLQAADGLRGGPGMLPKEQIAERAISAQNAYLLTDMMRDAVRRGTGRRAMALGRTDVAGKTGTTNEAKDTWFNGFTPDLVASVWVGFDQERSLGESEEGGKTALPIWVHFMREALKGVPDRHRSMPDGLIQLRISPETGLLASGENPDAILETFMVDHLPGGMLEDGEAQRPVDEVVSTESLF